MLSEPPERYDVTDWVGLGQPVDLVAVGPPAVVVARTYDLGPTGSVEVTGEAEAAPGIRRAYVPFVHPGVQALARGPVAHSPSGFGSFMVPLDRNVGRVVPGRGKAIDLVLPGQPWSAAVSDAGHLWLSLVDGKLLTRTPDGFVHTREGGRRYSFMTGGLDLLAAGSDGTNLCVVHADGSLRAEATIRTGHFAFAEPQRLVALEANGPVFVHVLDVAEKRHAREPLARSVHVMGIDPRGRDAVTRDDGGTVFHVDLETRVETELRVPEGFAPTHAAIDGRSRAVWALGRSADTRWLVQRLVAA